MRPHRLRRAGRLIHKGDDHLAQRTEHLLRACLASKAFLVGDHSRRAKAATRWQTDQPKTIEQRKLGADVRMFARDRGAETIDKLAALMRGAITVEIDRKPVEMFVPPMAQLTSAKGNCVMSESKEIARSIASDAPLRFVRPRAAVCSSLDDRLGQELKPRRIEAVLRDTEARREVAEALYALRRESNALWLNDARVAVKHKGTLSIQQNIEEFRSAIAAFLTEATPKVFQIAFDSISLSSHCLRPWDRTTSGPHCSRRRRLRKQGSLLTPWWKPPRRFIYPCETTGGSRRLACSTRPTPPVI
jgi:hypothetical protein